MVWYILLMQVWTFRGIGCIFKYYSCDAWCPFHHQRKVCFSNVIDAVTFTKLKLRHELSSNTSKMKTPACRTSRESMGGENSPKDFDFVTLTYNRWPWPCDIWPCPTTFNLDLVTLTYKRWPWPLWHLTLTYDLDLCDLELGWKLEFLHFFTLVTLTFDLWPWPSNLSEICWTSMYVPAFRSIGPTV